MSRQRRIASVQSARHCAGRPVALAGAMATHASIATTSTRRTSGRDIATNDTPLRLRASTTEGTSPARTSGRPEGGTVVARKEKRSEEHTSELQSLTNVVCRLLLEKKKRVTPGTLLLVWSSSEGFHTPLDPAASSACLA